MDGTFLVFLLLIVAVVIFVVVRRRQAAPAVAAPVAVAVAAAPARAGTGGEVLAAISAAVAVYMENEAPGVPYAITSVKPGAAAQVSGGIRRGGRPAWGFAGMRQNTEPF